MMPKRARQTISQSIEKRKTYHYHRRIYTDERDHRWYQAVGEGEKWLIDGRCLFEFLCSIVQYVWKIVTYRHDMWHNQRIYTWDSNGMVRIKIIIIMKKRGRTKKSRWRVDARNYFINSRDHSFNFFVPHEDLILTISASRQQLKQSITLTFK